MYDFSTRPSISLDNFIEAVSNDAPFTLSRWGDGEWASILGQGGENCDGVKYTRELQEGLIDMLVNRGPYNYGILKVALDVHKDKVAEWLGAHNINVGWKFADSLTVANRTGTLTPFINAINKIPMIYVGPKHIDEIDGFLLTLGAMVIVPPVEAFDYLDVIEEEVMSVVDQFGFIGVSMGPGGKLLIHRLNKHIGSTHKILDFGAMWDGYCGVYSRGYFRDTTWSDIMQKNLNGVIKP